MVQPFGQRSIGWFSIVAVIAILTMLHIGSWYKRRLLNATLHKKATPQPFIHLSRRRVHWVLAILVVLIFSKYFYLSCMTSYFTFFLIDKFHISVQASQFCLFAFLGASAIGTLGGGLLGDRFGRKYVIWASILGAAPFALMLPFASFGWTIALAVVVGLVISSAFSSIVVYATDLMPDKIGMISGVFFGLMFGLGGVGSAFFGWLADRTSVEYIFFISSFSPLLGIVAGLLPNTQKKAVSQHKLHLQSVDISAVGTQKPVVQSARIAETCLFKHPQARSIVGSHNRIHLMQMKHVAGILQQERHRIPAYSLPLIFTVNQQSDSRPSVHRIEIEKVNHPHSIVGSSQAHHHPELLLCKNVGSVVFKIFPNLMARERSRRTSETP